MISPKVVIYRPVDETEASHDELRDAGCNVVVESIDLPGAVHPVSHQDAAVLMGATFRGGIMSRKFLTGFPRLRLISKYTVGVDDIDLAAATEMGILVTHCPTEANCGGVAEGTVAMMLTALKKVRERDRHVKSGGWRDDALRGTYLGARADGYPGITVGVIGLGRIGSRVAELLRPWRVRLLASDPYVADEKFEALGVEQSELDALLRESDVVSIHCELTEETRGMLDAGHLGLMKASSVLVNTARGAIVDIDALCEALDAGRLATAILDVFPEEPVPEDAAVLSLGDKVLLSPHMTAANAGGTLQAAIPWATQATLAALRGDIPEHIYNKDALGRWTERFVGRSLL